MTIIRDIDKCTQIQVEGIERVGETPTCYFNAGDACNNTHSFLVSPITIEEITSYAWSTTEGTIIGSSTESTVVIDIPADITKVFTVTVTLANQYVSGDVSQQFTSYHEVIPTCIHANSDGTWYGYEYNNFGSSPTDFLESGERFYAQKWKEDGEWRLMFGDTGLDQLDDTTLISVSYLGVSRTAIWDGAGYVVYDSALTVDSMQNYEDCLRDYCVAITILPKKVIESDFKELTNG